MAVLAQLPRAARLPLLCALLLPSLLLILAAVQAQRSETRLVLSYRWVSHTHEVEKELQQVNLYATRMMASMRVTSDPEALRRATQAIKELTRDNPIQAKDILELERRVQAHLDGPAALSVASLDSLNEVSTRMWNEEERLLKVRQQSLLTRIRMRTLYLWGMVAFNAVLLGGVLLLVRRLTRLERLVHVCAWTRTIEYEGEWISFETYLERRFQIHTSHGIAPEEAERLLTELKGLDEAA